MLVGYARVSTQDQKPALQLDALKGNVALMRKWRAKAVRLRSSQWARST